MTNGARKPLHDAAAEAFKRHEGAPTWEDDPVARDAAIRWHLRGFEDGLNSRHPEGPEPEMLAPGESSACKGCGCPLGSDATLSGGFWCGHECHDPEPSADGPAFIAIMPPSPETSKRWYSMYCRECGIEEMMTETADDPRLIARRNEHNRERHQGEPSDAQVLARVIAKIDRIPDSDAVTLDKSDLRAALRAAGGVR